MYILNYITWTLPGSYRASVLAKFYKESLATQAFQNMFHGISVHKHDNYITPRGCNQVSYTEGFPLGCEIYFTVSICTGQVLDLSWSFWSEILSFVLRTKPRFLNAPSTLGCGYYIY